jgi:hypothetical protein
MRTLAVRIKTLLLGPLCELGCGEHVYPKDVAWHRAERCSMAQAEAS